MQIHHRQYGRPDRDVPEAVAVVTVSDHLRALVGAPPLRYEVWYRYAGEPWRVHSRPYATRMDAVCVAQELEWADE